MNRCSACPGIHMCIPPDGPQYQGCVLFIGEAPGPEEERRARKVPPGKPFQGKTGQEVDCHYLPYAGMQRRDILMVNAIQCLPPSAGGKLDSGSRRDQELLETCANHHLYPLIERLQPRALVPMGSFACRAVCPDVDLELGHGLPTKSPWGIPTFPMYHPALGIHEPKKMLYIRTDWHRLRSFLKGNLYVPTDAYPEPDYAEVTDVEEISAIDPDAPLAGDTESTRKREPFCLTYSQQPGTGRLIRATRRDLLQAFHARMQSHRAPVLFHNWLYDASVTQEMGIQFPVQHLVDTMARAFHLGNLPQGLKALAKRELGMEMQDFVDVVGPASREKVLNFYRLASLLTWPKPDEQLVDDGKGGFKLYKPQSMNTKLKRFFTDLSKDPDGKDVFTIWEKWDREAIEAECGEWPGQCISHVPFDDTLYYACRDVDALIRLWPVLRRMKSRVRKHSQEYWRVA